MRTTTEGTISKSKEMTSGTTVQESIYQLRVQWFHGGIEDHEFLTKLRELMTAEWRQHYTLLPVESC